MAKVPVIIWGCPLLILSLSLSVPIHCGCSDSPQVVPIDPKLSQFTPVTVPIHPGYVPIDPMLSQFTLVTVLIQPRFEDQTHLPLISDFYDQL